MAVVASTLMFQIKIQMSRTRYGKTSENLYSASELRKINHWHVRAKALMFYNQTSAYNQIITCKVLLYKPKYVIYLSSPHF